MADLAGCPYCGLRAEREKQVILESSQSLLVARCDQCGRSWTVGDGENPRIRSFGAPSSTATRSPWWFP